MTNKQSEKLTEFEVGKFYKRSTKERTWLVKITEIIDKQEEYYRGVCVKKSKIENYINDSDVFFKPKDCTEITEQEFVESFNQVIDLFKDKLK